LALANPIRGSQSGRTPMWPKPPLGLKAGAPLRVEGAPCSSRAALQSLEADSKGSILGQQTGEFMKDKIHVVADNGKHTVVADFDSAEAAANLV
jgi:hypothetical protein